MSDNSEPDKAEIRDLRMRIDELEESNRALWAWVKTLASQDAMSLDAIFAIMARHEGAKDLAIKTAEQIVKNHNSINFPEDEDK